MTEFRVGLGAKLAVTDRAVTIKNGLTTRAIPIRSIADVTRMLNKVRITDNAGRVYWISALKPSASGAIVDAILDAIEEATR